MDEDPFLQLRQHPDAPAKYEPGEEVPALKVKNVVVWENPNFTCEFSQKKGTECQLGLLFRLATDRMKTDGGKLTLRKHHERAGGIEPKIKIVDEYGRVYRDIDMKGVGWYSPITGRIEPWTTNPKDPRIMNGLFNESWATADSDFAEEFTKLGIRTHRSLGVVQLLELPVQERSGAVGLVPVGAIPRGNPLEPTHGVLVPDFVPVVEIRAFGIKTRLEEVISPLGIYGPELTREEADERRMRIGEAIAHVHAEDERVANVQSYAFWFARTLGQNIGRMHAAGYTHRYLVDGHNVTLDCSIVDLDSVSKYDLNSGVDVAKYKKEVVKDKGNTENLLKSYFEELDRLFPERGVKAASREFAAAYQAATGN